MQKLAFTTEHIRHLDIDGVAALTAPELACMLDDLAEQKASARADRRQGRAALDLNYGARARQRRAEAAKTPAPFASRTTASPSSPTCRSA